MTAREVFTVPATPEEMREAAKHFKEWARENANDRTLRMIARWYHLAAEALAERADVTEEASQ